MLPIQSSTRSIEEKRPIAAMGRFPTIAWGGEHKNEVIETDESIDLLRLESDGEQLPSQLPS